MSASKTPQVHSNNSLTSDIIHVALQQMTFYDPWQACLPSRAIVAPPYYDPKLGSLTMVLCLPQGVQPAAQIACM